jgi:hypothetical protein
MRKYKYTIFAALLSTFVLIGCTGAWVYDPDTTWINLPSHGMRYSEPTHGTICYENARGFLSCVRTFVTVEGLPPVITVPAPLPKPVPSGRNLEIDKDGYIVVPK